jgi:soluble lytic murein transglycosylase-like protein
MRRLAVIGALAAAAWSAGAVRASAQYLAVFVDGRVLPVAGARLVNEGTVRLEMSDGGAVEVPAARLERLVESATDPKPEPVAEPPCKAGWENQALPDGTPYAAEIERAARRAGLHPWLVAAVVEAESHYDRWAVSPVGARGLMQLMPSVWLPAGAADPHDVRTNLRLGCAYLKSLIARFGDLDLALAAYNAGPTTVERYGGVPPYRETRHYVNRIIGRFCPPPASAAAVASAGR